MRGFRRQLPVRSPLQLGAIASGLIPRHAALASLAARVRNEYGANAVTLTASGTVALSLSFLAAAPEGSRPRVALPAWACPDLLSAADAADAEVLLYDLDPATLAPDMDSLGAVLREGVHAVVIAHWFGLPVQLAEFESAVAAAGAQLIEDAAQGVGAMWNERPAGAIGEFGVLSFGRGKGRTGGGGGAILANTARAADALDRATRRLSPAASGLRGILGLALQWAAGRPALYGIPSRLPWLHLGETRYHGAPELSGMPARAAVVVEALWQFSKEAVAIRRVNAERWSSGMAGSRGLRGYAVVPGGVSGWLRFPVCASSAAAGRLASLAARARGVVRGYPQGLWEWPEASGRILSRGHYRGAELLTQSLFTLPTHGLVSDSDFSHVFQCVHES